MIVACFAAAVMVGCGNSASEELKDAKVVTSPEVNEVEIITLERTDFASQLLSNGKLKAARRASLSFGTGGIVSVLNVSNGGRVSTGSVIAELDREELRLALDAAEIALERSGLYSQGYSQRSC